MRMPRLTPRGWYWSDGNVSHTDPDCPQLTETDNPVVATLLGPDGQPIRQWRERPAFGFRSPAPRRSTSSPTCHGLSGGGDAVGQAASPEYDPEGEA